MSLLTFLASLDEHPSADKLRDGLSAQGRLRLFMGGATAIVLPSILGIVGSISNSLLLASLGYLLFCIAGVGLPRLLDHRRLLVFSYIATVLDPLVYMTYGLIIDEFSILFLGIYLFTIMGYGIRLGYRHLLACHIASLVSFAVVVLGSGDISGHWVLWVSYGYTLVAVPTYVGVLIRRLHASQRHLETMATRDPLTNLPNRRLLQDRLSKAITLAARIRCDVVVLYFDLDGFKKVNDTHGHPVGDKLLQTVAAVVSKIIRESDTFARIAGDEFAVVLEGGDGLSGAISVSRQILARLKGVTEIDHLPITISASIGVSLLSDLASRRETVDADSMIEDADQALYLAKRSGKNRYCISGRDLTDDIHGASAPARAVPVAP